MAVLTQSHIPVTRSEAPWAVRQGALAGVVAGLVFAAFEVIASTIMTGWPTEPLRMIGAIALGRTALDPDSSVVMAMTAGVVVHLALSAIYGAAFAVAAGGLRPRPTLIGLGAAYGLALWLLNFYVIAPALFPWFADANPGVQFVAHILFFGAPMGYVLWRAHEGLLRRAMVAP